MVLHLQPGELYTVLANAPSVSTAAVRFWDDGPSCWCFSTWRLFDSLVCPLASHHRGWFVVSFILRLYQAVDELDEDGISDPGVAAGADIAAVAAVGQAVAAPIAAVAAVGQAVAAVGQAVAAAAGGGGDVGGDGDDSSMVRTVSFVVVVSGLGPCRCGCHELFACVFGV